MSHLNPLSIGLFTPITNQCLKIVFDYLYALDQPATVYTLAGKRLKQSIELLSREKPITLHIIDANSTRNADLQNAIHEVVQRAARIVFFIPPGTRVAYRQSADHKQSMAALYASQLGKQIERIYVDDVAVPYGRYNQVWKKSAPDSYQLSLPLFNSQPVPPSFNKVQIAYQPPPKLDTPRSWQRKDHPARVPKWVERQILAPMSADLVADGWQIVGQSSQFDPPRHWPSLEAKRDDKSIQAVFALPNHLPSLIQDKVRAGTAVRWYSNGHVPSLLAGVYHLALNDDSRRLLDDLSQWLAFADHLTVNGNRYYLPADYHEAYGPARQWEVRYMYPLLTQQLDADGCPYRRQMPLGKYYADYVISGAGYTEIIECKRYPFRHSLRDALNQLLLYKHLYQYLFSVADSHPIKLTLVLPANTISAQVIDIAKQHEVTVRPLACDPIQTDMICKKHLAARVEKLANRIRSR